MQTDNIPLDESSPMFSSGEKENTLNEEELKENTLNEEEDFSLRYCLCIDGIPEYDFKDLESAQSFRKIIMDKKVRAMEKVNQRAEIVDDGDCTYRIKYNMYFMFLFICSYTIEKYEIYEMVKIRDKNFPKFLESSY